MKITQKQKRLVAGLIPVWRRTVKIEDIAEVLGSSILEAANV